MSIITAEEAARFLEENPRFFLENPQLLPASGLLEENGTPANILNLRNRLFELLRDERQELVELLDEIIENVRKNEDTENKFLEIEKILFSPPLAPEVLPRTAEALERLFSLDHASFLLLDSPGGHLRPAGEENPRLRFTPALEGEHAGAMERIALSGALSEGAGTLFPESCRAALRSTATVPLRSGDAFLGLLLLGSKSRERYREGMAAHLLERLALRLSLGLSLLLRLDDPPR
ncbi:MAG: DUF484 family protein [bacterium]|nr:DUF484 family protein [bacterium]